MSWTLCSSNACIAKAGANANATIVASATTLAEWSDEAEGQVNTTTRKDWVASYPTASTNFKKILDDLTSDIIAMKIIAYDMKGYTSRFEAQTMLDVLRDNIERNTNTLKEKSNQEKL